MGSAHYVVELDGSTPYGGTGSHSFFWVSFLCHGTLHMAASLPSWVARGVHGKQNMKQLYKSKSQIWSMMNWVSSFAVLCPKDRVKP